MKKLILLMSFIVLSTIVHAINYTTISVYQDGEWSSPFNIKTSVVYNEARKTITFSNNQFGKMVLKVNSSKRKGEMEYHMCKEITTGRFFIVTIAVENGIPYVSLSPSEDKIFLFGF